MGQAPQALVFVSNAAPSGGGNANLTPLDYKEPINIPLKANNSEAKGFVVVRNLGVVDAFEVSLFKLKPDTVYRIYVGDGKTPVGAFKTNPKGMVTGTAIGPLREIIARSSDRFPQPSRITVMEGDSVPDPAAAVLTSEASI